MDAGEWVAFVLGLLAGVAALGCYVYWVLTKGMRR